MSKFLDKLKEAEARRQDVIVGRKRLEAEAEAALATREREERGMPPRAEFTARTKAEERATQPAWPNRGPWVGAAVVIGLALAAGFWSGMFSAEREPIRETMNEPNAVPKTDPESGNPSFQLKFDRDMGAFAARVNGRPKQ